MPERISLVSFEVLSSWSAKIAHSAHEKRGRLNLLDNILFSKWFRCWMRWLSSVNEGRSLTSNRTLDSERQRKGRSVRERPYIAYVTIWERLALSLLEKEGETENFLLLSLFLIPFSFLFLFFFFSLSRIKIQSRSRRSRRNNLWILSTHSLFNPPSFKIKHD